MGPALAQGRQGALGVLPSELSAPHVTRKLNTEHEAEFYYSEALSFPA